MEEMLTVRMNTSMAGEGFTRTAGEKIDLPAQLARALCSLPEDAPRAEPVGWSLDQSEPQTATRAKRETATARAPREK